jgi:hypothetical protein
MGTTDNIMKSNHKCLCLDIYGEVLRIEGDQGRHSGERWTYNAAQCSLRRHHTIYNSSTTNTNRMTSLSTPLTRKVKVSFQYLKVLRLTYLLLCKCQFFQSCNTLIYTHNIENKKKDLYINNFYVQLDTAVR